MIDPHFVILGFLISLCGSLNYVWNTLRGKTRPNRVSWFMWAVAPMVAFGAEISKGVGLQSLLTFAVGFGPLLVFIASFINRKSVWKLSRFDIVCGSLSVLGMILWLLTRQGDIAIVFSIMADGLAAIPTIVKSYRDPSSERYLVFLLAAINAAITLLTIKHWNFATYGFPVYIFIICMILFVLIRFRLGDTIRRGLKVAA